MQTPDCITCLHCICYGRGYALAVALCRELRAEGTCQIRANLGLGQAVVLVMVVERIEDVRTTHANR